MCVHVWWAKCGQLVLMWPKMVCILMKHIHIHIHGRAGWWLCDLIKFIYQGSEKFGSFANTITIIIPNHAINYQLLFHISSLFGSYWSSCATIPRTCVIYSLIRLLLLNGTMEFIKSPNRLSVIIICMDCEATDHHHANGKNYAHFGSVHTF